jgi:hypothetical protein
MNQSDVQILREKTISRYVKALDAGNLDEIGSVLEIAEIDSELDHIISEINLAYAEELELSPISLEAEQVRELLKQHFPSSFGEPQDIPEITVGEVAAHIVASRTAPQAEKETSMKLLRIHIPLPDRLGLPEIRKLGQQFGFAVSERFLKLFREAAIQMSMGRGQAQMAAARRKAPRHRPASGRSGKENNDTK